MVNQQKVIEILRNIGETIEKEKLFLTELDNVRHWNDFKDGWNDTCIYGGRRIRTTLWDCIYEGRAIDGRKRCGGHQ